MNKDELLIDTIRFGCPNITPQFSVKITYIPTGWCSVESRMFRSQHKNKERCLEALKVLIGENYESS